MNWLVFAIAMLAGTTMAVQGTMNAALGKNVGIWGSTLMVHAVGLLTVIAVMVFLGEGLPEMKRWMAAPWYVYLGGLLNVLIIYGVVRAMPVIGVGNATTGIVFAQIMTAVLIDKFGLMGVERFPFRWLDLAGILLLAAGTRILLKT
ncbi:MAG: DMT family transporter [Solirubrobacterales bacterium]